MNKRHTYTCPKCRKSRSLSKEEYDVALWDKCCPECFDPDEGLESEDEDIL